MDQNSIYFFLLGMLAVLVAAQLIENFLHVPVSTTLLGAALYQLHQLNSKMDRRG